MKQQLLLLTLLALLFGCSKSDDKPGNALPVDYNNKGTGASARDILSASPFASVKIEIQYMTGFKPEDAAVDHLLNLIGARLNKPGGVQVVYKEIPASSKAVLSLDEVAMLEKQYRTVYTRGAEMGIYYLFTNGAYSKNNTLGIAFRNTSMCLFGKVINDHSGGVGQASRTVLQATVMEHELGHILGLVNIGSPIQADHKDTEHGNHCNNEHCLMYYAAETTDFLNFLGGSIPTFDAACVADLQANGGK